MSVLFNAAALQQKKHRADYRIYTRTNLRSERCNEILVNEFWKLRAGWFCGSNSAVLSCDAVNLIWPHLVLIRCSRIRAWNIWGYGAVETRRKRGRKNRRG
jgi:hypothetical protein